MRWVDNDIGRESLECLLSEILKKKPENFPVNCRACGTKDSVHVYFNSRGEKKIGGVWVWCSSCGSYMHASIFVPNWWVNMPSITEPELDSLPGKFELHAGEIDRYWNTVILTQ